MPIRMGMGDLPPSFLENVCQCSGSKSGWVIAKWAPASILAWNRSISSSRLSATGLTATPMVKLVAPPSVLPDESVQHLDQADRVHFIHAAGLGIVADRRRIAGNRQHVAHAAHGPGAEQRGLQADNILVARSQMRNRFDAAGF